MNRMTTIIRLILTAILIYSVYGETGPWTTLVVSLIALNNELVAYVMRQNNIYAKIPKKEKT